MGEPIGRREEAFGGPPSGPRQYPYLIEACSIVILLVFGWLDYITGYDFGFFIFYFIPVSISAWYAGRRSGLAMAVASAVAWYLSDVLAHHPYSKSYFLYWETFMRLASFLTTALTLAKIRENLANERQLNAELRRLREENQRLRGAMGEEAPAVTPPQARTS